jgi:hypothetical protein
VQVDNFGIISIALHGRVPIEKAEIARIYPGLRVPNEAIGELLLPTLTPTDKHSTESNSKEKRGER